MSMAAYARHDAQFFSRRAIVFIAIVVIHVLLYFALESGLATRIIHAKDTILETNIVQDIKQRELPPPPPPPKMEKPPVEIPPPEIAINLPAEPSTTAITQITTKHVEAPPAPPHVAVRTAQSVSKMPNPQDYYPAASVRMSETGSTLIKLCWGADGKVAGMPTVEKSSGSSRLDEAATRLGTHVVMKPATVDGKPIEGCSTLPVKFVLN
jgi:periplasmic protein TonB